MNWYYAERGRQAGPVQQSELDELVRTGAVPVSTLVWREGMPEWKPYSSIGLAAGAGKPASDFSAVSGETCVSCGGATGPSESARLAGGTVCARCQPVYVERLREGDLPAVPGSVPYAGFWIRFAARMADYSLLNLVQSAFISTFFSWMLMPTKARFDSDALASYGITTLAGMALSFCYQVGFLTRRGATPGKMICHLRVVRADQSPVNVWSAVARYFGEVVEIFTLTIGYLMAAFDPEKRALHDRIAGTRVVDFVPEAAEAGAEKKLVPVERELRCATCRAPIPSIDWNSPAPVRCSGCGTAVQAIAFPALTRTIADAAPQIKSGDGEAACYYHDGNRATISCQECGRFLCPVCDLDSGNGHLCPTCLNGHLAKSEAPQFVRRRILYDSMALTAAVVPILLVFTIYLTILTAPAVIGFTIWSWRKPGAITARGKWRFVLAVLIASVNILSILIVATLLAASIFRQGAR